MSSLLKSLRQILYLNCEGAAHLLSDEQDRSLLRSERWALRMHLLVCAACRQYKKQVAVIGDAVRRLASQKEPLPAELEAAKQRIARRLSDS
ncbi:MAG: hypothetical protein KDA61_21920 [Planctomycetales bacterium]|nr:hypothetical protein [Planctomycetales bacterium]